MTGRCVGSKGYHVYSHRVDEIPSPWHDNFLLGQEHYNYVKMKAVYRSVSDDLVRFDRNLRQCYFPHEYPLVYFKTYTKVNCELECFSMLMHSKCNCLMFFMPKFNDTPICGSADLHCYLNFSLNWIRIKEASNSCQCYPPCEDVEYNVHRFYESSIGLEDIFRRSMIEKYDSETER
jgi:acid-sensing ion channel, other